MNTELIEKNTAFFQKKFGHLPQKIVLSPGRINLIGEHVDYNDGFVLPAAIDKLICFAFEKNNSQTATIVAIDLDETVTLDLNEPPTLSDTIWTNYLRGVLLELRKKGYDLAGFNCVFSSSIPVGSGLSSSAALECGFLYGLNELFQLKLQPLTIALMGQSAEHWVGIHCGIMDQFASVMGKANQVIKIDCRSLEYEYHKADFSDYSLVLFDSNVKHSLFSSAYNQRRQECEDGWAILAANFPELNSFRDCSEAQILSIKDKMPPNIFKRCFYVVKEIKRVSLACEALDQGKIETLGELMFETHEGLSKEYEVSCPELDFIVSTLKQESEVVGSRLMGGGFGGCTINLIKKGALKTIQSKLEPLYKAQFGIDLKTYEVQIGNGTSVYPIT